MTRWRLYALAAGLLLSLLAGTYELGNRAGRARSVRVERLRIVDTLRIIERHYARDTAIYWRTRQRWDTIVHEVTRIEPHLIRDTVWVVRALALADTTIRQCTQALRTCEQVAGLQRQRAELAEHEAALLRGRIPTRTERTLTHAAAFTAGIAAVLLVR
jgi:hypothetical protein